MASSNARDISFYYSPSSGDYNVASSAGAITYDVWQHVAVVSNNSAIKIYVNGTQVASGTQSLFNSSNPSTVNIGRFMDYTGVNSQPFIGYISNLRFVTGTALYTTTFTPSTTPLTAISGTNLLICQNSRFVDNSFNNYAVSSTQGTPTVQRFSPFNPVTQTPQTYSGYFNGSSDYLIFPDSASFDYLTGDFSCDMWVYPTSVTGDKCLLQLGNYGAGQTGILFFLSGTGRIFIGYNNAFIGESTGSVVINTWSYLSWIRTSGVLKMYVNGVEKVSSSFTSSIAPATYFGIGVNLNPVTNYFPGYISSVRLSNIARSFTVPTVPTTSDANTQLLTCQSTTFIDNSTNAFAITATGSPVPRAFNPFGFTSATTTGYTVSTIGGSGYFDGSGDYLSVADNAAFVVGSGSFAIEAWIYPTQVAAAESPIFKLHSADSIIELRQNTNKLDCFLAEISTVVTTSTGTIAMAVNTWNHVAFVRNGTTTYTFVNGVLDQTKTAQTQNLTTLVTTKRIAANQLTNAFFSGYISNFRFVNGTAIYTSNFVPPSAPLTAVQNTVLLNNMTSTGIYDAAMMNNMETVGDAKLSTAISKFGGSSMSFDGTGDYLTVPSTPNLAFGGNFTVEAWLYLTSAPTGANAMYVCDFRNGSTSNFGFGVIASSGNTKPYMYVGSGPVTTICATSVSLNTWYHIAMVRSGSTVTYYLNGVSDGTMTTSFSQGVTGMTIGARYTGATEYINGYIDDLRITKGYARYTTNFSVPTSAFPIF